MNKVIKALLETVVICAGFILYVMALCGTLSDNPLPWAIIFGTITISTLYGPSIMEEIRYIISIPKKGATRLSNKW